jgi:hypothetical protein
MFPTSTLNKLYCLVAACAVFAVARAGASQGLPWSVEQLAARAQRVIHGRVASVTCLKDGRGAIYTRIELDVIEVWKGPATNHFVIVQSGGILGDERVQVVGQAEYHPGEEIVDFLAVNTRGEGASLGAGAGKFTVWRDGRTGVTRAASLYLGRGSSGGAESSVITIDDLRSRMTGGQK